MCGFAGILSARPRQGDDLQRLAAAMAATLRHRGPDDEGAWGDTACGIAFGFRRLAVLDLSEAGHQPMASASGRYTIAFNGEIYNFAELREELEARGQRFRGHSDTEVLLAGFEEWGRVETLRRANGMFAFALWDRQERELTLARDRVGEKPLYYAWCGGDFVFGSQLSALRRHPEFDGSVDPRSLDRFCRLGYVPAPATIHPAAFKLAPGSFLVIRDAGDRAPAIESYWSLAQVALAGADNRFRGTRDEAVDALERLLADSVARRMVADVPVGAFLSGGIDSSTVVALMQKAGGRPARTYSIGFEEKGFDESAEAAAVARHLGTEHSELRVSSAEALAVVPELSSIYDEPFADSSQIPTCLVARLARRDVTVSLSGDGGDEVFGGYNRHVWAGTRAGAVARLPRGARKLAAAAMRAVPPRAWDALLGGAAVPASLRLRQPSVKVRKAASAMAADSALDLWRSVVEGWAGTELVPGVRRNEFAVDVPPLPSLAEQLMWIDAAVYLPDDILVKLDRATMAVSLEGRVPLLDPRVIEFAWSLPLEWKIEGGRGKAILRDVLARHVPPALFERPKSGFAVPLGEWLRGPLREWGESLLQPAGEFFDAAAVRACWAEHLGGRAGREAELWPVFTFVEWARSRRRDGPA